jgi:hypothetical protein
MSLEDMATIHDPRMKDQHPGPADPVINTLMTGRVIAVLPGMALDSISRSLLYVALCPVAIVRDSTASSPE